MNYSIIQKILNFKINQKIISSFGICKCTENIFLNKKNINNKFQNIIVLLFPYYNDNKFGNLAKFCRSYDYHILILMELNKICKLLKIKFNNNFFSPYCDITFINEVKAAYISGAGILGKHGLIIDKTYGPFVFIGEIITDLKLNINKINIKDNKCSECKYCLIKCPVSLKKQYCISSISQKKTQLNKNEIDLMKNSTYIWGCDLCINACSEINKYNIINNQFNENLIRNITLDEINSLSNKEFKQIYFNRSFIWRGKSTIQRNLLLKI